MEDGEECSQLKETEQAITQKSMNQCIFSPALSIFEKMFDFNERKQNIMKMTIYQGALMSLQHMEDDNKDDPMQALYARRVKTTQIKKYIFSVKK